MTVATEKETTRTDAPFRLLVFEDYVIPFDKVTYIERVVQIEAKAAKKPGDVGRPGLRIHFVSYGFIEVPGIWNDFLDQVVLALGDGT